MSVRKQERQYCLQTLGQSSSKPVLPRELHLQRVPGCLAGTGYRLALRDTALLYPSCLRGPRSEMQQRPEQADHKHFWARRFVAHWKTIVTRRCDIYTKNCTFRQLFLPQTASSYESTFSLLSDTALSVCSFVVWCQETYLHSVQWSLAIVCEIQGRAYRRAAFTAGSERAISRSVSVRAEIKRQWTAAGTETEM